MCFTRSQRNHDFTAYIVRVYSRDASERLSGSVFFRELAPSEILVFGFKAKFFN